MSFIDDDVNEGSSRQLLVEINETDGSRWMAPVPLTEQWTYHVLSPDDFSYWPPGSAAGGGRGGPKDSFQPRHAVRVSFGLAFVSYATLLQRIPLNVAQAIFSIQFVA